jgi:pantothenate kinase
VTALDLLVSRVARHRLIGIAGAPGSGKSTIADALAQRLGSSVVIPMDGFHLPQARLVELGRRDRMGAPDTFDVEAFVETVARLSTTKATVLAPAFDRTIEEPVPGAIELPPELDHVIIEGNYLLLDSGGWQRVAPLLDITVFLELDPETRQQRLIERHLRFGKSEPDARAWTLGPDESNALLIEATAGRADFRLDVSAQPE